MSEQDELERLRKLEGAARRLDAFIETNRFTMSENMDYDAIVHLSRLRTELKVIGGWDK